MIAWKMLVGVWLLVCFFALAGVFIVALAVGLVIAAAVTLVRWCVGRAERRRLEREVFAAPTSFREVTESSPPPSKEKP